MITIASFGIILVEIKRIFTLTNSTNPGSMMKKQNHVNFISKILQKLGSINLSLLLKV